MDEQIKTIEITCRNCEELFPVPETTLTRPDVPCPKCGFVNSVTKSGKSSKISILEKLTPIFGGTGDESEDGSGANIGGGIGLIVAVVLVIIYSLLTMEAPALKTSPVTSNTVTSSTATSNTVTNSVGMQFTLIQPGTFTMGSDQGNEDEKPAHLVTISKPFLMGIHEVTVGQWIEVMEEQPMFQMPLENPILLVTWDQAKQFCEKLSNKENASYRLPTEAEWEYAIRAGTTTEFYWGDNYVDDYGWNHLNSGRPTRSTHPVGKLKPNAWGLFDMSGNVAEWCEDHYGIYTAEDQIDPSGPTDGNLRVVRGGDYATIPIGLKSASRGKSTPDLPGPGFRVIKNP